MKARWMLEASERRHIKAGTIAPPMMAMTNSDEPSLVYEPRFFTLNAKIVGNMIEWKNPTSTIAHTGTDPTANITTIKQISEPAAKMLSKRGGGTFFIM